MPATNKSISLIKIILKYTRHITFIFFLIAMICLFPSFKKTDFGNICFYISIVYIIATFIMIFIKNEQEETKALNNFVLIFLHLYICLIAYKYQIISDYVINTNTSYFKFNFIIISICMIILIINKFLISNN